MNVRVWSLDQDGQQLQVWNCPELLDISKSLFDVGSATHTHTTNSLVALAIDLDCTSVVPVLEYAQTWTTNDSPTM